MSGVFYGDVVEVELVVLLFRFLALCLWFRLVLRVCDLFLRVLLLL
jgi:hypothetical protein